MYLVSFLGTTEYVGIFTKKVCFYDVHICERSNDVQSCKNEAPKFGHKVEKKCLELKLGLDILRRPKNLKESPTFL